jgi:hypothetical protein
MTWFTETPWPGVMIALCLAGASLALWLQQRRSVHLMGAIGLALLAPVLYFVEEAIVTPRERAELAVREITRAFQQGDIEATRSYISKRSPHLSLLAEAVIGVVKVGDDMRISDFRIEMSGKNTRANAKFRLNATISIEANGFQAFEPTRWESTWQLEANQWRLIKLQELDPITGQPLARIDAILYGIMTRSGGRG